MSTVLSENKSRRRVKHTLFGTYSVFHFWIAQSSPETGAPKSTILVTNRNLLSWVASIFQWKFVQCWRITVPCSREQISRLSPSRSRPPRESKPGHPTEKPNVDNSRRHSGKCLSGVNTPRDVVVFSVCEMDGWSHPIWEHFERRH